MERRSRGVLHGARARLYSRLRDADGSHARGQCGVFGGEVFSRVRIRRTENDPGVRFMPTGGVGEDNLAEYLREKSVFACGGSWMVPPRDVAEGNFDKVVSLVKKACAIAAQA